MYSKSILALAAVLGAANASPVVKRQETVTASLTATVSSAPASSAAATTTVTSTDAASSAPASSVPASSTMMMSSEAAASTPGATPTATSTDIGGQMYPLYPCPSGYMLAFGQYNQTLQMPIDQATTMVGEWANSPIFPNISNSMGASMPGDTHTWNIMEVAYAETLVNATSPNMTSAYVQWTYNSTMPILAMGVTFNNYQSVFKAYDPTFPETMMRGNTTLVQIFTNACADNREMGVTVLENVHMMQLSALGNMTSNSTSGGQIITQTVATNTLSQTETATATATATATSAVTATSSAVQTNTIVQVTASESVTVSVSETVTPVTETAVSTAATVVTTAETQTVTSMAPPAQTTVSQTVATTTATA